MKGLAILIFGLAAASYAQAQGMQGMDMKDMHKDMPGMQHDANAPIHEASGTVTKVDRERSRVTIRHGAVKTLDWPAMSMTFAVRDKALLEKLQPDRKVNFQFVQEGKSYVITGVK
jgi:Cu(I)/Ag(I) efflux system protein CusF